MVKVESSTVSAESQSYRMVKKLKKKKVIKNNFAPLANET